MSLLGRSEDGIRRKYILCPRLQVTFYLLGVIAVVNLYPSAAGLSYLSRLDSSRPSWGPGGPRSLTLTRGWVWRSPGPWSMTSTTTAAWWPRRSALGWWQKTRCSSATALTMSLTRYWVARTADSRHSPRCLSSPGLPGDNTTWIRDTSQDVGQWNFIIAFLKNSILQFQMAVVSKPRGETWWLFASGLVTPLSGRRRPPSGLGQTPSSRLQRHWRRTLKSRRWTLRTSLTMASPKWDR